YPGSRQWRRPRPVSTCGLGASLRWPNGCAAPDLSFSIRSLSKSRAGSPEDIVCTLGQRAASHVSALADGPGGESTWGADSRELRGFPFRADSLLCPVGASLPS